MRVVWNGVFVAAVLVLAAARVRAQEIRGTIRDDASGAPISGAVVAALSGRDSVVGRTLSTTDGAFTLRADAAVRIRVVHIGYRPTSATASSGALEIAMTRLPAMLDTVRTVSNAACPARADADRAAGLWSQAQAALLAAVVARDANPARVRAVEYRRVMGGPGMSQIVALAVHLDTAVRTRVFSTKRPPSYFEQHGFVVHTDSGTILYAPDEDALLDDSFARTHCFHVEHDRHRAGEIGLAFAPIPARDTVPDLTGTLWMDSARAGIVNVDFSYTALPASAGDPRGAGGSVEFTTAANGIPLITAWTVRQPTRPTPAQLLMHRVNTQMWMIGATQVIDGGALEIATWADGTTEKGALSSISGTVVDPATGKALAGIPVALVTAGRTTRTDSLGRWAFDALVPGPYALAVDDTLSEVFRDMVGGHAPSYEGAEISRWHMNVSESVHGHGVGPRFTQTIQIDSGVSAPITIELPSIEERFRRKCGDQLAGDSAGVLAIWARESELPARKARIGVLAAGMGATGGVVVKTDDEGRAIVCGAPRGRPVRMTAAFGKSAPVSWSITPDRGHLVTLVVIEF